MPPVAEAWSDYIGRFHRERAGITERLLSRALDDCGVEPYAWVTSPLKSGGLVLDVGCGSAPTSVGVERWVGVDASRVELATAQAHSRGPLIRARAEALPIKSGSVGAAVAVMTLMVFDEPLAAAHEVARVVAPRGQIGLLLPCDGPLTFADRVFYTLLLAVLGRTAMPFPSPAVVREPRKVLRDSGLFVIEDQRRRFGFSLSGNNAAELFMDSLYLRGVSSRRSRLARWLLVRWPVNVIGIPLRRVVARVPDATGASSSP